MEEIVSLTKELIRFKTMHARPEEISACAAFIETYMKQYGISCRRMDRDGVPSLFALPQPDFAPVILMAHIDVVDAPDELFSPSERDGRLYGRGSLDDKYAVALSLVLLKEHLKEVRKEGKGQEALPFGILITGDEEVGGHRGAKEALGEFKTEFCIALDGGSLDKIVTKEKGILRLRLISRGRSAHGARPWLGENAIEKLFADYLMIRPLFELQAPEHWHRTINFSIVHAGKSANQVPDYAEALFDIRYTEDDPVEELVEKIRKEIKGELVVVAREPVFRGGDSPYLDLLLQISEGTRVGFEHGASDARFLVEQGARGIVWGADGDQSQHAQDEHVNIESVYSLYRVLHAFMRRIGEARPF